MSHKQPLRARYDLCRTNEAQSNIGAMTFLLWRISYLICTLGTERKEVCYFKGKSLISCLGWQQTAGLSAGSRPFQRLSYGGTICSTLHISSFIFQ